MKKCASKKCVLINPQILSNFYKNKSMPDGLCIHCKQCSNRSNMRHYYANHEKYLEDRRQWHRKNRDRALKVGRVNWLKRNYNITIDQYNKMLTDQLNKCAICLRSASEFKKRLAVDHCHATGKIRSLLCPNCNQMIGCSKEKISNLKSALKYLQKFKK